MTLLKKQNNSFCSATPALSLFVVRSKQGLAVLPLFTVPSMYRQQKQHRSMYTYLEVEEEKLKAYVSGFVDGEACFSVSCRFLKKLRFGIEIRPSFSIAQKKSPRNYDLLLLIRNLFCGGAIRDDGRGCYKYETRSLRVLLQTVIPFFKAYPLRTDKGNDFLLFADICSRMKKGDHKKLPTLKAILKSMQSLNPSGKRKHEIHVMLSFLVHQRCT